MEIHFEPQQTLKGDVPLPKVTSNGRRALNRLLSGTNSVFGFLSSIRLAVIVLPAFALSLTVATVLESLYDTQTAQYWVYRSFWFSLLLFFFSVNILCAALSRLPWRQRHIPFLTAHLGILLLMAGSWLTQIKGLDGNLRVTEGEMGTLVEMDQNQLVLLERTEGAPLRAVNIPWVPPHQKFKSLDLRKAGVPWDLSVTEQISRADSEFRFIPSEEASVADEAKMPAIHLIISGGPMKIRQDFWLWAGERSTREIQAGPTLLTIHGGAAKNLKAASAILKSSGKPASGRPGVGIVGLAGGGFAYRLQGSQGGEVEGEVLPNAKLGLLPADQAGWKAGVHLEFAEWIANATPIAKYSPARIQYGPSAPPPAIKLKYGPGGEGQEIWLGVGDRATLNLDGHPVDVAFLPHRIVLPFGIRLEKFDIERYQGTADPSSYQSRVTVIDGNYTQKALIKMNEPLTYKGLTFYQASYEDGQPRPVTSILSVNQDPGRPMKYFGSLLIVLGSILLFVMKLRQKKSRLV